MPTPTHIPLQVLVALDDERVLATVRTALEPGGHHLTLAHDRDAAQKLMLTTQFDCALVDIVPPDFTGLRILGIVRRSMRYRDLPVGVVAARPNTMLSLLRATHLTEGVLLARPDTRDLARAVEILGTPLLRPLKPLAQGNLRGGGAAAGDPRRLARTVVLAI